MAATPLLHLGTQVIHKPLEREVKGPTPPGRLWGPWDPTEPNQTWFAFEHEGLAHAAPPRTPKPIPVPRAKQDVGLPPGSPCERG